MVNSFNLTYNLSWAFLKPAIHLLGTDFEVNGRENIPQDSRFIAAANHSSMMDIPAVVISLYPHRVRFIMKQSHSQGIVGKGYGLFNPIIANGAYFGREFYDVIQNNQTIGIFPEGTRSLDGKISRFKSGATKISEMLNLPILPLGISGTYENWPRNKLLPSGGKVTVNIGRQIEPGASVEYLHKQIKTLSGQ